MEIVGLHNYMLKLLDLIITLQYETQSFFCLTLRLVSCLPLCILDSPYQHICILARELKERKRGHTSFLYDLGVACITFFIEVKFTKHKIHTYNPQGQQHCLQHRRASPETNDSEKGRVSTLRAVTSKAPWESIWKLRWLTFYFYNFS